MEGKRESVPNCKTQIQTNFPLSVVNYATI